MYIDDVIEKKESLRAMHLGDSFWIPLVLVHGFVNKYP